MQFEVAVDIRLKEGVADPQGATIERSLPTLGFDGIRGVAVGKRIWFTIEAESEAAARTEADDLCARFLSNPVIEDSTLTLREVSPA